MSKSPNRLLASLPADAFSAISPHLKIVELKFGDVVAETGSPIRQVYFPYSGVISLVVELEIGAMVETAMVGRDGVLNAAPALDGKVSLNKGIVQSAGSAGTIEVNRFRRLANEFEPFRSLLIRHEQVLFAQSQQSAACNASHSGVEALIRDTLPSSAGAAFKTPSRPTIAVSTIAPISSSTTSEMTPE